MDILIRKNKTGLLKRSRKGLAKVACSLSVFAIVVAAVLLSFSRKSETAKATVGDVASFAYSGYTQTFTAPEAGNYEFQVWGARGGGTATTTVGLGGNGGYAVGVYALAKGQTVAINVGGQGSGVNGGWNGGGNGSTGTAQDYNATYNNDGAGGGGASDITVDGNRVIVAGGGGGAGGRYSNSRPNNPYAYNGVTGAPAGIAGFSTTASILTSSGGGAGTASTVGIGGTATSSSVAVANTDGVYYPSGAGGGGGGYFGGGGAGGSREGDSVLALGVAGTDGASEQGGNGGEAATSGVAYYATGGGSGGGGSSYAGGVVSANGIIAETYNGNQNFVSPTGANVIGNAGNGFAKISQLSHVATTKFTANGGTGDDFEVSADASGNIVFPANIFVKIGYSFTGWSYNDTTYQPGDTVPVSSDQIFYAQWVSTATPEQRPTVTDQIILSAPNTGLRKK